MTSGVSVGERHEQERDSRLRPGISSLSFAALSLDSFLQFATQLIDLARMIGSIVREPG